MNEVNIGATRLQAKFPVLLAFVGNPEPPGGESSPAGTVDSHVAGAVTISAPGHNAHIQMEQLNMTPALTGVLAEHIKAVNAFDTEAIVATFAPDAYVNDNRREIRGINAIRRWVEKEMVGDKVTLDVREVVDHYGDIIVRAAYDGEYDKSALPPGELVMSNYFSVRGGKIISLAVIRNQPSPY